LLAIDDEMRLLIHNGANETDVKRLAERHGMTAMRSDAMRWVTAGVTSQEEVVRVTRE
jgi:general secretion pathway protein E